MAHQKLKLSLLVCAASLIPAGAAFAQAAPVSGSPATGLTEIVVTAQRRTENLQSVPITVEAVGAAKLAAASIQNTQDLVRVVPGLTFPSTEGTALPHLRGVGNTAAAPGAENSVALYVDGVYYATAAGSILSLNNVAQIEVLKGPQGTLFGRNATGGLIQVNTKDPTQTFHGDANISYGNFDTSQFEGYVTGGLTDHVAADFALQMSHQGEGYGTDLATGKDVYKTDRDISARSKILWTPSSDTRVRLSFDYENSRSSQGALQEIPGTSAANRFYPNTPGVVEPGGYNVDENLQPVAQLQSGGASLRIEQDLGPVRLVDITAYRREKFYFTVDPDLGPQTYISVISPQQDEQVTQELQLQSRRSGPLQYTFGLFYIHANDSFSPLQLSFGGAAANPVGPGLSLTGVTTAAEQVTDSIAGYGQATYKILPGTELTGGIRLTYESKSLSGYTLGHINNAFIIPFGSDANSFDVTKPSWRVSLDHHFTDDVLGYVSFNRGFKSGGYNLSAPALAPYQTEQLDAYEIGVKSSFLERRLRINASTFYYDYDNIQITRFVQGSAEIYNGAGAQIYGVDLDVDYAVTSDFTLSGGLEALHDEFTAFPCADFYSGGANVSSAACSASIAPSLPYDRSAKGNQLPDAPTVDATISADYRFKLLSGAADATLSESYNGGYYSEPNNELRQRAYSVVNASLRWNAPSERYFVRLWAKNLTDTRYTVELSSSPDNLAQALAPPRTYGFTVGASF